MTKTSRSTPWRDVVRRREELKTGELSLAQFAADLHEVAQGAGTRRVYEDPAKFFALTFRLWSIGTAPHAPLRGVGADQDVGVPLPARRLWSDRDCAARPAARNGAELRSAFPCLRVACAQSGLRHTP